jgi:hypothetical protein
LYEKYGGLESSSFGFCHKTYGSSSQKKEAESVKRPHTTRSLTDKTLSLSLITIMPSTWVAEEIKARDRQELEDQLHEAMDNTTATSKTSKVKFDLEDATQVHEITSRYELSPELL